MAGTGGRDIISVRIAGPDVQAAEDAGDRLATCLYQAAELYLPGYKIRKDLTDGDPDWESDFTILKNTLCASALSENLFHDNADDLAFLESPEGKRAIISLHVEGIVNYIRQTAL